MLSQTLTIRIENQYHFGLDFTEPVAESGAPGDGDPGAEVGQAVRQIHQHADERHDVPAGRVARVAEAHPRDPGGHGGPAGLGRPAGGGARDALAPAGHRRAHVQVVSDAGARDGRHAALLDALRARAVPAARARRPARRHAQLQPTAALRPQVPSLERSVPPPSFPRNLGQTPWNYR